MESISVYISPLDLVVGTTSTISCVETGSRLSSSSMNKQLPNVDSDKMNLSLNLFIKKYVNTLVEHPRTHGSWILNEHPWPLNKVTLNCSWFSIGTPLNLLLQQSQWSYIVCWEWELHNPTRRVGCRCYLVYDAYQRSNNIVSVVRRETAWRVHSIHPHWGIWFVIISWVVSLVFFDAWWTQGLSCSTIVLWVWRGDSTWSSGSECWRPNHVPYHRWSQICLSDWERYNYSWVFGCVDLPSFSLVYIYIVFFSNIFKKTFNLCFYCMTEFQLPSLD